MNYKVIVDAGHGGDDPGAVSGNLKEKDFNLEAANYMYNRFRELGVPVAITRDVDKTLTREERLNTMNNNFGNGPEVIILSNHINSGGGEGAEIVYPLRSTDTLARSILESIGQEGQIMRKYYQRRLPENPSKDYYYIMRETPNTTSLLIEYGFIDNPNDVKKLQNNLLDYAEAVVRAVARYIGVPYTAPGGVTESTYVVQRGDSLYSIAQKFNTTVDKLKELNNLTSNNLSIGQVLVISEEQGSSPSDDYIIYTVKRGDSLWNIARDFDTTVDAIIDLNNLGTTALSVGQTLKIPQKTESSLTYTVKSGDSLWKIANSFGVTVDSIIQTNNLSSTTLSIGQQLIIPGASTTPEPTPPEDNETQLYVVKSGDSLWSIARQFNTTVSEIRAANNLTSDVLSIGQLLRIPGNNNSGSNGTIYYVKSGDSLWKIANQFGTTVDEIRRLNGLTSNVLQIGQQLIIPS